MKNNIGNGIQLPQQVEIQHLNLMMMHFMMIMEVILMMMIMGVMHLMMIIGGDAAPDNE